MGRRVARRGAVAGPRRRRRPLDRRDRGIVACARAARRGPRGQMVRGIENAAAEVRDTTAALLWPARMIWVGAETITSLIEAHGTDTGTVLRPSWQGDAGWPVLLPLAHLEQLRMVSPELDPVAAMDALTDRPRRARSTSATQASCSMPRPRRPTCRRTRARASRPVGTCTSGASTSKASRTSPARAEPCRRIPRRRREAQRTPDDLQARRASLRGVPSGRDPAARSPRRSRRSRERRPPAAEPTAPRRAAPSPGRPSRRAARAG